MLSVICHQIMESFEDSLSPQHGVQLCNKSWIYSSEGLIHNCDNQHHDLRIICQLCWGSSFTYTKEIPIPTPPPEKKKKNLMFTGQKSVSNTAHLFSHIIKIPCLIFIQEYIQLPVQYIQVNLVISELCHLIINITWFLGSWESRAQVDFQFHRHLPSMSFQCWTDQTSFLMSIWQHQAVHSPP